MILMAFTLSGRKQLGTRTLHAGPPEHDLLNPGQTAVSAEGVWWTKKTDKSVAPMEGRCGNQGLADPYGRGYFVESSTDGVLTTCIYVFAADVLRVLTTSPSEVCPGISNSSHGGCSSSKKGFMPYPRVDTSYVNFDIRSTILAMVFAADDYGVLFTDYADPTGEPGETAGCCSSSLSGYVFGGWRQLTSETFTQLSTARRFEFASENQTTTILQLSIEMYYNECCNSSLKGYSFGHFYHDASALHYVSTLREYVFATDATATDVAVDVVQDAPAAPNAAVNSTLVGVTVTATNMYYRAFADGETLLVNNSYLGSISQQYSFGVNSTTKGYFTCQVDGPVTLGFCDFAVDGLMQLTGINIPMQQNYQYNDVRGAFFDTTDNNMYVFSN